MGEGLIIKEHKRTWGNENVLCVDCGGYYITVYICQNFYILKKDKVYCM